MLKKVIVISPKRQWQDFLIIIIIIMPDYYYGIFKGAYNFIAFVERRFHRPSYF